MLAQTLDEVSVKVFVRQGAGTRVHKDGEISVQAQFARRGLALDGEDIHSLYPAPIRVFLPNPSHGGPWDAATAEKISLAGLQALQTARAKQAELFPDIHYEHDGQRYCPYCGRDEGHGHHRGCTQAQGGSMKTISLKAIDVGFDLRTVGVPVDLSKEPERLLVEFDGGFFVGSRQEVALNLAGMGFAVVVARHQGREIRVVKGKFEAQPPSDNYWQSFDTLSEAVAFAKGRKAR